MPDASRQYEDFVKSMKPGWLGGHGGGLLLYYMLGSDPALWPAGEWRERGLITHDKGYYHSLKKHTRKHHAHRQVGACSCGVVSHWSARCGWLAL